jgi:transcriptional regulator with XRE-family HTH domain
MSYLSAVQDMSRISTGISTGRSSQVHQWPLSYNYVTLARTRVPRRSQPVAERGSPNLARRRRLAAELRRLRERAGLTGDEVASRLQWRSSSKLSRIEHGSSGLKQADLQSLLDLYEVTNARRAELIALAEESRRSGPVKATSMRLPEEHVAFVEAEADAGSVSIWEPQIFPGLFQVEDYTRALLEAWVTRFSLPKGEVDRRVEARRLRQEILNRDPPLQIVAVIDESVLHRRIGEGSVMHRQLMHLVAVSELPNVDIRVLPLSGNHLVVTGAFNYLRFHQIHDVPLNDMVALEKLTETEYVEAEEDSHQYLVAFESLMSNALSTEETRALIVSTASRLWAV